MDKVQNILFILVDQWPAQAFSGFGAAVTTPNTDRLAGRSTVFSNAFTSCPLCSPARGALLTARWPHQTGLLDNVGIGYSQQEALSPSETTWIDAAVAQGYSTGYFGKWHLGEDGPILRGAHRHSDSFEPGLPSYDPQTSKFSYQAAAQRYVEQTQHLTKGEAPFYGILPQSKEETIPFTLAAEACGFLDEYTNTDRQSPFFCTLSINPPHFPHFLPEEYEALLDVDAVELPDNLEDAFEGKPFFHGVPWWPSMDTKRFTPSDWKRIIAYANLHIRLVDDAIGTVLDRLEQLGLADDTIVVFTADHGDMNGAHNRFDKGPYFYDEVWRIPLFVSVPGSPAAHNPAYVSLLDLGHTFFQWLNTPEQPDKPRMGRDLTPLLGQASTKDWPAYAYGAYDLYNGMSFAVRAIRSEYEKYVWNPQDVDEFYDLEQDPHELHNLSGQPSVQARETALKEQLFAWLQDIGDDLPQRSQNLPKAGTILATGKVGP